MANGLNGIGLGVANKADWAALDPTGAIDTWDVATAGVEHSPLGICNDPFGVVERNAVEFATEVTHRTIDRLNRELSRFAGSSYPSGAIELGALKPDCRYLAIGSHNLFG